MNAHVFDWFGQCAFFFLIIIYGRKDENNALLFVWRFPALSFILFTENVCKHFSKHQRGHFVMLLSLMLVFIGAHDHDS